MSIKEKIYSVIQEKKESSIYNGIFNIFITSLILLSVLEVTLESFDTIKQQFGYYFQKFELFTITVFTIEYLLRIWTADLLYPNKDSFLSRVKFVFSVSGLIDLIAIIPFYLPLVLDLRSSRILRLFRLVRVFKLKRYSSTIQILGFVFKEKKQELIITFTFALFIVFISSTLMYQVEGKIQPDKFPNVIATFWWSIATLTTVGYGDVFPITALGKIISSIIAITGIGLVALPTGIISSGFIAQLKSSSNDHLDLCPHCGEYLNNIINED